MLTIELNSEGEIECSTQAIRKFSIKKGTDKSLESSHLLHKRDSNEVRKTPRRHLQIGLLSGIIDILLEF
jgi:hypothetical protein